MIYFCFGTDGKEVLDYVKRKHPIARFDIGASGPALIFPELTKVNGQIYPRGNKEIVEAIATFIQKYRYAVIASLHEISIQCIKSLIRYGYISSEDINITIIYDGSHSTRIEVAEDGGFLDPIPNGSDLELGFYLLFTDDVFPSFGLTKDARNEDD